MFGKQLKVRRNGQGGRGRTRMLAALLATAALGWTGLPALAQSGFSQLSTPENNCENETVPPPPCEEGEECGEETCPNTSASGSSSYFDSNSLAFLHFGYDYRTDSPRHSGCASCGAAAAPDQSQLPALTLKRVFKPRDFGFYSSLGLNTGFDFDACLLLHETTGGTRVELRSFDLSNKGFDLRDDGRVLDAAIDGIYTASKHMHNGWVKDVRLFDAADQLTADQSQAVEAVLTWGDGRQEIYEIINVSNDPAAVDRQGRLVAKRDRNGNELTIAFAHPAGATDTELGGDRTRLWIKASVTDAYGRQATFTYQPQSVQGRWLVERIDLPNGESVTYEYQSPTVARLTQVHHPDGSVSRFAYGTDAATQTKTVDIFEATEQGTHRNKRVYLTQGSWVGTNPDGTTYTLSQAAGMLRMIRWGATDTDPGELRYLNWTEAVDANVEKTYVYHGGNKLERLTFDGLKMTLRERAVTWSFDDDPGTPGVDESDSANWTFETVASFGDYRHEMAGLETDALGRSSEWTKDLTNRTYTGLTHPDQSTESWQYNQFKQKTRHVDRLGRVTETAYDAAGNKLSRTVAEGTADEATESWTYNVKGQCTSHTDFNGNVTNYEYTAEAYLWKVIQPADVAGGERPTTVYDYDAAGRMISSTDPMGRTATYVYDGLNRVTKITYADGSSERFVYADRDEDGTVDEAENADANLLVRKYDRVGNLEECFFDAAGRQIQCIEAAGTPEASATATAYLAGTERPTSITSDGETTAYAYDHENRRIATTVQPNGHTALISSIAYDQQGRLAWQEDPYGRRTYLVYENDEDRVTRSVAETVPGGAGAVPQGLDAAGAQARQTYLSGLTRDLSANAAYLIEDRTLDAEGRMLASVDGRGVTTTYGYDARDRRVETVEAVGTAVAATVKTYYDDNSNVVRIESPRHFAELGDFVATMAYTGRNLLASRTEAAGTAAEATASFTYYLDGRAKDATDARGYVTTSTWGACCARIQAAVQPLAEVDDSGTPKRSARTTRHDDNGNLTHEGVLADHAGGVFFPGLGGVNVTDLPDGDTLMEATTRYDARNRPVARTVWLSPRGPVNANNPPIAGEGGVPAADGLTTYYAYDDNLTDGAGVDLDYAAQLAKLGVGFFAAGSDGRAVVVTNPEGETNVAVYDGAGRRVMSIDGLGHASVMTYDAMENGVPGSAGTLVATTSSDPLDHVTVAYADAAGRTIAVKDALGHYATFAYDAQGNRTSQRDANGIGDDCLYDERGRRTLCTETGGESESWAYDAHNNVVQATDAKNVSETFVYDARDRRMTHTDRNGGVTKFAYDDNSNLLSIEDADAVANNTGEKTLYVYDPRNLKISESYPGHAAGSSVGDAGYDQRLYAYDGMGRLRGQTDQRGVQVTYLYDLAGRPKNRSYAAAAGTPGASVAGVGTSDTFGYDAASRLTSATSGLYGNSVARSYDDAGRMAGESQSVGGVSYGVGYAYDAASRLLTLTYPDGTTSTRAYTARNELDTVAFDAQQVVDRGYDAGGRLTSTAYANGVTETRGHVPQENLLASISAPGVTDFTYGYDANDNRTKETDGVVNAWSWNTGANGYDASDRLIGWDRTNGDSRLWDLSFVGDWDSVTRNGVQENRSHDAVHQLTQVAAQPLAYDAAGNLTGNSNGQGYAWDVENRLVSASDASGQLGSYAYDAMGRRVSKTVGGVTTLYVSAGPREVAEYVQGQPAASPSRLYAFGDYVDEVLMTAIPNGGGFTRLYHHHDGLYSTRALTDATGALVERYAYDPYGQAWFLDAAGVLLAAQTSPSGNAVLFTGRRLDEETGLQYSRARYLDHELGRWIGRDPIGYIDSKSLYAYVGLRPTRFTDPSGFQSESPTTRQGGEDPCCTLTVTASNAFGIPGLAHLAIETGKGGDTTLIELQSYNDKRHDGANRIGSGPLGPTEYVRWASLLSSLGMTDRLTGANDLTNSLAGVSVAGAIDLLNQIGLSTVGGGPRDWYGLYASPGLQGRGKRCDVPLPPGQECETLDRIREAAELIGESTQDAMMGIPINAQIEVWGHPVNIRVNVGLEVGLGYDFVGRNSNAFVGTTLRDAGVDVSGLQDCIGSAPGFGNDFDGPTIWDDTLQGMFQGAAEAAMNNFNQ